MEQIKGQYQLVIIGRFQFSQDVFSAIRIYSAKKYKNDILIFKQSFDPLFENVKREFGTQKQLWFSVC